LKPPNSYEPTNITGGPTALLVDGVQVPPMPHRHSKRGDFNGKDLGLTGGCHQDEKNRTLNTTAIPLLSDMTNKHSYLVA